MKLRRLHDIHDIASCTISDRVFNTDPFVILGAKIYASAAPFLKELPLCSVKC